MRKKSIEKANKRKLRAKLLKESYAKGLFWNVLEEHYGLKRKDVLERMKIALETKEEED